METLVLENLYKIIAPYAAPNKGTPIFFTDLGLLSTVLSPIGNSRIQGLFKPFGLFSRFGKTTTLLGLDHLPGSE